MKSYLKPVNICFTIILLFSLGVHQLKSQDNLISNGGFESGVDGWTVWGATLATTTDAHSGTSAAKVSNRQNSWDALVRNLKPLVSNGDSYTLSAWVKILGPAVDFRATLNLRVDGVNSYNNYLWTSNPVVGSYQYYEAIVPVSWTGNLEVANLYFETGPVDGVYPDYIIDDVSLVINPKDPDPESIDSMGLKDIRSYMRIGATVTEGSKNYFNNETAKAVFLKDNNAANVQCYPAWGRWDETEKHVYHLDEFNSHVKEMKDKNIFVTTHMLFGWDKYFPEWYRTGDFHADTLEAIMYSWMDAIIGENGNDTLVDIWNLVNESISWDGKGGYWPVNSDDFENACELQRMGFEPDASGLTGEMKVNEEHPVYIRKALEYARTLTDKKLELRETSCEFPSSQKYDAFYQLALHLKNVGAPVDVIGLQCHLDIGINYNWEGFINNIKRFRALGYEVTITEVDIGTKDKIWDDVKAQKQKESFAALINAAIRAGVKEFNTWGMIDEDSGWRGGEYAFQYDYYFNPKPAYYGMEEELIDMSSILFWEMDSWENDSLPDAMPYENYGILNNFVEPAPVEGFISGALEFDGTDDFISSKILSDSIHKDLTFSCFIKTSSETESIIADLGNESVSGLKIGMNPEGNIFLDSDGTGLSEDITWTMPVNDGSWHFIAIQRDSASYKLYIDGSEPVRSEQGSIEKYDQLNLGSKRDGSLPFQGIIDEVKLFDYAVNVESFERTYRPTSPLNLRVSHTRMRIKLEWNENSLREEGYIIERKINDGEWETIDSLDTETFKLVLDLELYSTSYSFRIRAYNKFSNSEPSNIVTVISPEDPNTGIFEDRSEPDINFSVYPNPSNDSVTLISDEKTAVVIYNMKGVSLLKINGFSGKEIINIQDFPSGIYLIRYTGDNGSGVTRLVKE